MTQTTHLLKTYAVTLEVSPTQFQELGDFLRASLEKQLQVETDAIGMAIVTTRHRQEVRMNFDEETGNTYETILLACVAHGYLTAESAEQTLQKLAIDNAQSVWIDDND